MSGLLHAKSLSPLWRVGIRQAPARPVADTVAPAPSQSHLVLKRLHAPVQLEFEFRRVDAPTRGNGAQPTQPGALADETD